VNNLDIITL